MALNRRILLRNAGVAAGGLLLPLLRPLPAGAAPLATELERRLGACTPPSDPLSTLLERNARFSQAWQSAAAAATAEERAERMHAVWQASCQIDPAAMARGQKPWAALLSCADSRVAPEWIFASGEGELFDVRCAGNTAFDEGIASLEYAVAVLSVPLIVVLGHSGCGAVTAALSSDPLTPLLEDLVRPIRASLRPGDALSRAVEANAFHAAGELTRRSEVLREAAESERLRIQPACFDLGSGRVSLV